MRTDILLRIRGNPNLYNYIKYHSYWYKELIRNPNNISIIENEMKKEYKLTAGDRLNRINERVKMIRTFLEVLK